MFEARMAQKSIFVSKYASKQKEAQHNGTKIIECAKLAKKTRAKKPEKSLE